jgi:hypothetical protein
MGLRGTDRLVHSTPHPLRAEGSRFISSIENACFHLFPQIRLREIPDFDSQFLAPEPKGTFGLLLKMKLETLDDVVTGASKHSAVPLWPQMTKFNPPAPNPKCVPHIWRYDEVRPYLLRAGELVTEKDAERRVLMLVNPARGEFSPPLHRKFRI